MRGALFIVASLAASFDVLVSRGGGRSGLRVMDFNKVLAKVKEAPAFQQQSAKVMPTFCEGSDDMAACKGAIEHGLLCKAFMGKAQEFAQQGMPGAAQFAQKCGPILATSFMDVSGWVEKPGDLFMDLSGKAKKTMAVEDKKAAEDFFHTDENEA
jgi:hypothetical protein